MAFHVDLHSKQGAKSTSIKQGFIYTPAELLKDANVVSACVTWCIGEGFRDH